MKKSILIPLFAILGLLYSCAQNGPQDISLGSDACDFCKMTITEKEFAAELLTSKGRIYKFDDHRCLTGYKSSNPEKAAGSTSYLIDFPSGEFLEETKATLLTGGTIKSPMGGNTRAYKEASVAQKDAVTTGAKINP